jgi:two-component system response regulator AtoC
MKLLIIDDDEGIRSTLELHLRSRFAMKAAADLTSGKQLWSEFEPEIVLLDLMLPDGKGTALLEAMGAGLSKAVVIMITGHHEMEHAVHAMKHGAFNYIRKPLDIHELDAALKAAMKQVTAEQSAKEFQVGEGYSPLRIAGKSQAILEIHKQIGLAAKSRVNVLIQGGSGTGKELVARAIHENSSPQEPFVAINCSAIVPTLAESELFGHEKGAFTGAAQQSIGKLERAGTGTLFLDEIGDMSLDLQAKLLRVLQERKFERVGGSESIQFPARVIAATHQQLEAQIKEGRFREDLYYRLNVLTIEIPPLRERTEDIPELVSHLLEKINRELHRKIGRIPDSVVKQLQAYDWPGNVRELENVLTQAVVRTSGNVLAMDFPQGLSANAGVKPDDRRSLADVEREHIRRVLVLTEGNLGEACEVLGISRPTLRKKMEEYKLRS